VKRQFSPECIILRIDYMFFGTIFHVDFKKYSPGLQNINVCTVLEDFQ